jgi:cytochrome P450
MSSTCLPLNAIGAHSQRDSLPPDAPLPSALQTLAFWRDPHLYLRLCRRQYGSRFTITPIGKPPLVFTSAPSDIRSIVRAPADVLHPGAGGAVIAPLVGGNSFMLSEGERHLAGRRAVLQGFRRERIGEHANMVREIAIREIASWPLDTPSPLHPQLRALTLRVILQMIFDREDSLLDDLHAKLLTMFTVTGSLVLQEPRLRRLPHWHREWGTFMAARSDVDRLLTHLIEDDKHTSARDHCMLAMLLTTPGGDGHGTNTRLRETLMSVILAGHETTASQLAWAFQLLAHNPTKHERLLDDLAHGGERYLTAVIYEALRHRPVFLFTIPRAVARPFTLGTTTYHSPVHLVGCTHLMHHDPALYEAPNAFRPERFLDNDPSPDKWMPWGGGRKHCPGHHLAMLEMRTILQTVLSHLEVRPATARVETARWRSVIVTPGKGCRVTLRKRASRTGHPSLESRPFLK